jgi:hypothetical protein
MKRTDRSQLQVYYDPLPPSSEIFISGFNTNNTNNNTKHKPSRQRPFLQRKMHLLKTLFALIPLIAAVVGYTLPEGTPDGFYSITFDANGNSNLTRLPDALVARSDGQTRTVVSSAKFAKRDSGNLAKRDTWGYTGRSFPNHNDYNACTDGWHNYYAGGGTVPPRTVYVLQVGQAILAVCNYLWGKYKKKEV